MTSPTITFTHQTTARHVMIALAGVLLPIIGMGITLWLIGRNPTPLVLLFGAVTLIIWGITLGKARLYAKGRAGGALMYRLYHHIFTLPFQFYDALSKPDRIRYGQARIAWVGLWDTALVPMLVAVMMLIVAWLWSGVALIPMLTLWGAGTLITLIVIWRTPPYPTKPQQVITTDMIVHIGELRNLDALGWMMRRWWDARPRWIELDWVAGRFLSLMLVLVMCLTVLVMPHAPIIRLAGLLLGYGALAWGLDALAEGVRGTRLILINTTIEKPLIKWGKGAKIIPLHSMGRGLGGGDKHTIHIQNLTFAYRHAPKPALNNITLSISAGKLVGVVGKTGSGKSALLWALLGFDPPQHGTILYDDLPLPHHAEAIRRQVGMVGEWSRVHRGSVLMNIAGHTRGTIERAWQVAELVGLSDFITGLPMEMHTIIDDDGAVFSEGQRGRLLLARALFPHPKILLLDEALGSVDESLEVMIHQNIAPLGMTRVMVTHRRKTLMLADEIIVLDGGRVVQHGAYDDLLAQAGLFADMMGTQIT